MAASTDQNTADNRFFRSRNALYIIDKDHRVVNFNEKMKFRYPSLKVGDICYSSIMKQPEVCKACPLEMDNDEDLTFYNSALSQWVSIRRAEIEYPGVGHCGVLSCHTSDDMRGRIQNRMPILSGYDVYIEMNLTKNCYRIILPNDPSQEKDFSKDRLDDLIQRTADNLVHPMDRDAFLEFWDVNTLLERLNGPERKIHGVFRECRKSGIWDTIYITIIPEEYYGTSDVMIMALYMIIPGRAAEDSKRTQEEEVYIGDHKVNFDYMTGLPLRRSYWEVIEQRLSVGGLKEEGYCVLASDIENFHIINNWFGREAGDHLLSEIGSFLKSCESSMGILSGYMGGDNFCSIFRYNPETLDQILQGMNQILEDFREKTGFRFVFGAYCTDLTDITPADAYDLCILAIKRNANNNSRNLYWYDERMIEEQQEEEELLLRFEKGMANGEITFYLQPKCDIRTGRIVGSEALARWISPELGFISPAKFIPVLEKTGKIAALDYYIWKSVCRTIADWRHAGLPVLPVSVNVSRMDVFSMDIVYSFTDLVEKYGLQAADLEIEITESAYMENDSIIREVQSGLHMAGFNTLIDDFGSGFSSLNFLKDVDVDAIKLDLRFLEISTENAEKGTSIISSVLNLAKRLNMAAIAEGVETKEQADFLAYKGCPLAQGYYFYSPMPVAEFEKLLKDPNRILEGMHLSDFVTDLKQVADLDLKTFSGFDEKLEEFMKNLMDVATLVRVVDVYNNQEFRLGMDGHLKKKEGHCYDIWGRKRPCKNCISAVAVQSRKVASKYESLGRDTYFILAKPVIIGGEIYSMETAIKMI